MGFWSDWLVRRKRLLSGECHSCGANPVCKTRKLLGRSQVGLTGMASDAMLLVGAARLTRPPMTGGSQAEGIFNSATMAELYVMA